MTTQTEHPLATAHDTKETKKEEERNQLFKCPKCGQYSHLDEFERYVPQQYPEVLFKEVKHEEPPVQQPEVETVTVNNEEEEKKKLAEGWSKDPPKPKPSPTTSDVGAKPDEPGKQAEQHHGIFGSHHNDPKKK
jgi:hypothetical protein